MIELDITREWAAEARDDRWDKKCFALQRFMAGDPSFVSKLFEEGNFSLSGYDGEDMLEFPWTDPSIAMAGVQNHAYINARINVQGIVYSTPEVICDCMHPLIRKINNDWFKQRYHNGMFASKMFQVGMDVQAFGIGFVDLGIGLDGAFTIRPRSKLDTLVDPTARDPDGWRFVWLRDRLDFHQANAKYGISKEVFDKYARKGVKEYDTIGGNVSGTPVTGMQTSYIYEWGFWSLQSHHVVLGSIANKECPVYVLKDGKYKLNTGTKSGDNPMGTIPLAVWVDSWMSGSRRPTGMLETAWRSASMLNLIELSMREILLRGIPMTIVSAAGLNPEIAKKIAEAEGPKDIARIIMTELPEAAQALVRVPAVGIPQEYLALEVSTTNKLNAATGVMDMERGQALSGRRTAQEIRVLEDEQGIQAHHARQRAAECLRTIFLKGRLIASKFETVPTHLEGDDYEIDSENDDLAAILAYPLDAQIEEASLQYSSQETKAQRRLTEFQMVDMAAIQAGVGDPEKIFSDVYKSLGVVDPYTRLYSPEQKMQMQEQQAMMQMQNPGGTEPNGEDNGRNTDA